MKDNLAFDANYEKHIEIPEILVTTLFCFLFLESSCKDVDDDLSQEFSSSTAVLRSINISYQKSDNFYFIKFIYS